MPKQPDLSTSLRKAAGSRAAVPSPAVSPQTSSPVPPSRAGTVSMTLHVPLEVRNQLKRLALDRRTTLHALCGEAFNMLFAREGQPEIAPATPRRGNGAMA
ncbi:MAG: hypothetical protein F4Y94_07490 [Chloroflexi bacterium]|nr:hypothetical protein [Chloroflexota bacterium]